MNTTAENIMLTTGKAAAVCGVTSDAVLKWIKSGKLKGTRTAGGHYRISQKNLASVAPHATPSLPVNDGKAKKPCWEFNAKDGHINPKCLICVVYTSKAEKCYVMAALGKRAGHQGLFCKSSCEKCRYFFYANGLLKVLIISRQWEQYKFCKTGADCSINLRFACCGYEVSMLVSEFKPDAVLFDETLSIADLAELVSHLKNDPRLLKVRILFISRTPIMENRLPEGIDRTLKAPFSIPELKRTFFSLKDTGR